MDKEREDAIRRGNDIARQIPWMGHIVSAVDDLLGEVDRLRNILVDKTCTLEDLKLQLATWHSEQGHDRCHYYPDIFRKLTEIMGFQPPEGLDDLPPRAEFEDGCRRYQDELYGLKTDEQV